MESGESYYSYIIIIDRRVFRNYVRLNVFRIGFGFDQVSGFRSKTIHKGLTDPKGREKRERRIFIFEEPRVPSGGIKFLLKQLGRPQNGL
jgi:hypothetical protein